MLTGADGTIGAGALKALTSEGFEVVTNGHKPGLSDYTCDFSVAESLAEAIDAIGGPIHGMVFAHGMLQAGPIDKVAPAAWRLTNAVNLDSIYALIHAALPYIETGVSRGAVSSTAAFDHSPGGGPHYTASKWGLNGLVRHLAFDLGPRGIRINSVCPGTVEGPMARALLSEADYVESLKAIPLGRAAEASEIADLILFLLSSKSAYMTGANISASGGYR